MSEPLDLSLPLELDDGRPVQLVYGSDKRFTVMVKGNVFRPEWADEFDSDGESTHGEAFDVGDRRIPWVFNRDGTFSVGNNWKKAAFFRIRNIDLGPDKSKEWFI